jgi:hypothetical protein
MMDGQKDAARHELMWAVRLLQWDASDTICHHVDSMHAQLRQLHSALTSV